MHTVVSKLTAPLAAGLLLGAGLVAPALAAADTVQQRPSTADQPLPGTFTALTPTRIFDSRPTHIAAGVRRTFNGQGGSTGVPTANVSAIVVSVTVLTPPVSGYVTVYPGSTKPGSTTVNFPAGRQLANLAVVKVIPGQPMSIFNGATRPVDAVVVVTGYYASGGTADGSFNAVGPLRVVDTNTTTPTAPSGARAGSIPANGYRSYRIAGTNGVSTGAGGAIMNVAVVPGSAGGYLAVGAGSVRPATSNVNLIPGQTLGTLTAVQLAGDGTFSLFNASSTPVRVVVDLAGWFRGSTASTTGQFSSLPPARVFSSRTGQGTTKAQVAGGATRTIKVTGSNGIPLSGVGAVALTLTAAGATAPGYLTAYSGGTPPTSSTLSFPAGVTVPGFAIVPVDGNGNITVLNGSTKPVDIIGDVSGYVRNTNRATPDVSTSRYIRSSITPQMTIAQATAAGRALGTGDGQNASTTDPQLILLQFGAQSLKAGGDGSGTGNLPGVRLSTTNTRITYPQVVAAVDGYTAGYTAARGTGSPVTVAVGTSNDGYKNDDGTPAAYTPTAKGTDWSNSVVEPAVAGAAAGVTVVAGNDIEAGFDGDIGEVADWIRAYLAAGSNALINNGSATLCPGGTGRVNGFCGSVAVEQSTAVHTWSQGQYFQISGGISPTRISVLPQIYDDSAASQWANISLSRPSGSAVLTFAGVLTSVAACGTGSCPVPSIAPQDAYAAMNAALDANPATAATTIPAVTDIAIS